MTEGHRIFDRSLLRLRRDRAAAGFNAFDFLLKEMAERLCDRLEDIRRRFPLALDLGAHGGALAALLEGRGGIETLVQSDLSEKFIAAAPGAKLVMDEELLAFAPDTFDAVLSAGSLHWVNDLPGTFAQIGRALKKDGLFLANFPGASTLKELREAFEQTELAMLGGVSPHVSPFVDVRDAGALLQRAGFALPVIDSEMLTVSFENPLALLHDLRGMGEMSALAQGSRRFTRRSVLLAALDYYQQKFSDEKDRVTATFEIVTVTGWRA